MRTNGLIGQYSKVLKGLRMTLKPRKSKATGAKRSAERSVTV